MQPVSPPKTPIMLTTAQKFQEITKRLEKVRTEQAKLNPLVIKPKHNGAISDYSKRPKKPLFHPRLNYILGEVVFSPYRTSPMVGAIQSSSC